MVFELLERRHSKATAPMAPELKAPELDAHVFEPAPSLRQIRKTTEPTTALKIVHVVRQFYPAIGGFESVVFELARAQIAAGHSVRVVTLDRLFKTEGAAKLAAQENVAGIEIIRIPYVGSTRYPIAPSVLKHIGDSDLVHVHAIDFFFDFLAWTKPIHKKPLVVSTHGGFFHTGFAARLKRIYFSTVTRGSISWYSGVAAVSPADQEQFSAIRPRGMVCIENGVNTTKFSDCSSRAPRKSLLWIGRFSDNKKLDRLMLFLAALLKLDPEWKLVIAGRPWDLVLADVRRLAAAAGVESALTIVEAPSDSQMRTIIGDCSFIVSTSDYEGFGIAAIEGMSAGLFPLLSDIPTFRRLAHEGGHGLLLNFANEGEAALQFFEKSGEIFRDYGFYRGRSLEVAANYDWKNVGRLYQSFYDSALGNKSRSILNVPVFVGTEAEAVDKIDADYAGGKSTVVAFANAHALNVASINDQFRDVLKSCLVLNDGVGIDAASRILFGTRFPHNLNGTDFTPNYFKNTKNTYRIFFLGSSSGIAERASGRLLAMCGGRHQMVGCQNGYSRAGDNQFIVDKIRASDADVVLVAMGNPAQEMWLAENLEATGARLGFAVGALFDFLSDDIPRAPSWMRSIRMEWVYRLMREPGRLWRRYVLGNPLFLMRILNQWLSGARV
jgi:alpha-1,3-mannosyltransferase